MNENQIDIRKEAKILSLVAEFIAKGEIKPTEEQVQMIINLNNQLYRNYAKQKENLER